MTIKVEDVLKERGERYGSFARHAIISQNLKLVVHEEIAKKNKQLDADQYEAIEMIFHKIARIINGDPDYADNWVDIAGYATLVADRLTKQTNDANASEL